MPRWYAVRTRSRHERKVRDQLIERQIETFLPLWDRWSRWKDRMKKVEAPLFSGYCFARFVVSERLACTQQDRRAALLAELESGQVRSGVITSVCSFGAFVDLGGVEGLLHISEISWGRVNHPGDCLKAGQSVRALLMSVDRENERVALSVKRLYPDPWMTVSERYSVGQVVQCVVTSVVAFGAFARLEDGLEGLIHVSELAEGNFMHPRNVVCEGQTVRVRVLNVDAAHRRLGLSLRRVDGDLVERAT